MTTSPKHFKLSVADRDIQDLNERLSRTRMPDEPPGLAAWQSGTDKRYLWELIDYWRTDFDWRAEEAGLNAWPQFKIPINGVDLHFIRADGQGPDPVPLLLMHGWPGSVFEFIDILPRLTDPERFGRDPADSFTVIAPSLPGYGLSFLPNQPRFGIAAIADIMAELMTKVLGFQKFAAQGGDWGAFCCSSLGVRHPEKLIGLHQNMVAIRPDPDLPAEASEAERQYAAEIANWLHEETGYTLIQGTRPQTLAYGLTDSPAGLAAWITEKFHVWTDNDGDLESAVSRDRMLANISLYWFTGAIGSSFWPYFDRHHGPWPIPEGRTIDVPFGYAAFPKEIRRPPRSIAERTYTDIRQWTVMAKGGHFAAMEQPQALAEDIQAFFRPLRG